MRRWRDVGRSVREERHENRLKHIGGTAKVGLANHLSRHLTLLECAIIKLSAVMRRQSFELLCTVVCEYRLLSDVWRAPHLMIRLNDSKDDTLNASFTQAAVVDASLLHMRRQCNHELGT